jgi:hypothetical protein
MISNISCYDALSVENFDSIITAVQDYSKGNTTEETSEMAINIKQVLHLFIKKKIIFTFSKRTMRRSLTVRPREGF